MAKRKISSKRTSHTKTTQCKNCQIKAGLKKKYSKKY